MQGCLGWDTKPRNGCFAATVTSDKWFVLMLRTQHVLRGLRRCTDIASAEARSEYAEPTDGLVHLYFKLNDTHNTLQVRLASVLDLVHLYFKLN